LFLSFTESQSYLVVRARSNLHTRVSRETVLILLESETSSGRYVQAIVNSRGVKTEDNYVIAMGYGTDGAKYENTKFQIKGTTGKVKAKGTKTGGKDFSAIANYFEDQSIHEIPNCKIVA